MRKGNLHRVRASVIAVDRHSRRFLLMYRNINGVEKYVLLGGGVKNGESPEKAAIREAKEEANLDVKLDKKIAEIKYKRCTDNVFLANDFSGEMKLSGEELDRQSENNIYRPEWIKIDDIENLNIPIYPKFIVKLIINEL